jgi:hypothetical protein
LLYRITRARCGNVLLAIGLTAVAVAGSSIHWLARPHLATLLLTVVFLGILESGRRPLLWLLPPLTALWVNLHAGFIFGLMMIAAYAVGERTRSRALSFWLAALASLGASLANPYGGRLHVHIWRYLAPGAWHFGHINEFLSPSFHAPLALFFELMLGLGVAAAAWHLTRRRLHYTVLLAATAHMALVSARNIPIFLIVASPAVAVAVREWMEAAAAGDLPRLAQRCLAGFARLADNAGAVERLARVPAASLLGALVLAASLSAPSASGKLRAEFDPRVFPVHAAATLGVAGTRIFTSDQWGDYLIYRFYPDIRVFVDGRSDFYGGNLEQIWLDVWNVRYDWQHTLGQYGVDTVLLPAAAPLAGALKESRRWRVVYDDGSAIVFRQNGAGEAQPVSGGNLVAVHPSGISAITLRSESK